MKTKVILTKDDLIKFLETCNNVDFTLISFQRKFRTFFKFSIISDTLFCMTSKITNNSILVSIESGSKNPHIETNDYFKCAYSFIDKEFNFPVTTAKDLILKLIKHEIY